jgi:hypothetical protein
MRLGFGSTRAARAVLRAVLVLVQVSAQALARNLAAALRSTVSQFMVPALPMPRSEAVRVLAQVM